MIFANREAEIWVKKAGAADYEKVADASFGGTGWQAVAFEEVKDVTERLIQINPALAKEARKVLDTNKSERHIRGGMATREKYLHKMLSE